MSEAKKSKRVDKKKEKKVDETKESTPEETLDVSLEWVVEPILKEVYKHLEWKEVQNLSLVCRGWKAASTGEVGDEAEYLGKYKEAYPNKENKANDFYRWRAGRTTHAFEQSFLVLLESQMLLRELASYKRPQDLRDKRDLYEQIREQIMKFPMGDQDEQDLLDRIAALRLQLMKGFSRNAALEKKHKILEHKIGLLISHRSSIIELDRARQKRKQNQGQIAAGDKATFYTNKTMMGHYANLFYLLRTEPSYLAKLTFLLPADLQKKQQFAETCILTMYANAFSPLEELLLLELLSLALLSEVEHSKSAKDFLEQDSVGIMMVISYNKRKQGKNYIRNFFKDPIKELEKEDMFGAAPTDDPKIDKLTKWCELFFGLIFDSLDQLPYGLRYLCKQLNSMLKTAFPNTPEGTFLSAVGYVVFYRFVNLMFIKPEMWGLVDDDVVVSNTTFVLNLASIAKVLKSLFTDIQELDDPKLSGMNSWIKSKIPQVRQYLQDIPNVPGAEEYLQVNKYAQLGKQEKDSIVIRLSEIALIHDLCKSNVKELGEDEEDPLRKILGDLGDVPSVPHNDETEVELALENRFPPQLSKMDLKKNLKTETIDAAIKIMQKLPGFTGNTFLEIFVRMKLHLKKTGDEELSREVHNVIANLQNLAKYGLISADDGYNGFLIDIQQELAARGRRRAEQIKEIERLTTAIEELDAQEVFMNGKIDDFNSYLDSIRAKLRDNFQRKEKSFSYKQLSNKKLNIIHSSEIPEAQQGKVKFTITQEDVEEFVCRGKIKGLPMFKREFKLNLSALLEAKEDGRQVFDTDEGLELNVQNTLIFLNKNFFASKK